ncbi:hypothetical protein LR48_Vigan06g044500 [Vigna angularis]|uniref:Uncharacterized protein n=1 Tax=Phaseolus angularis TaxID=3914 RepID=A0A0L9URH9_PHAAN|nr:hypothetical protein LR48_Vigan06g044500 [Vigna angularis]
MYEGEQQRRRAAEKESSREGEQQRRRAAEKESSREGGNKYFNFRKRRRRSEDVEACDKKKTDVDGSNGCSGRSKPREGGPMIQRRQWFLGDLSLILGMVCDEKWSMVYSGQRLCLRAMIIADNVPESAWGIVWPRFEAEPRVSND